MGQHEQKWEQFGTNLKHSSNMAKKWKTQNTGGLWIGTDFNSSFFLIIPNYTI